MEQLKFIIGHVRPAVAFPSGFRYVTGEPQGDEDVAVPLKEVVDAGLTDRRLGEYAFLFALARVLPRSQTGTATICQYRRFVLNRPLGSAASNIPFARVLSAQEFVRSVDELALAPPRAPWMINTLALTSGPVLAHYARYHVLRDWLRFLSDAVDAAVLTDVEAAEASLIDGLIPAPSNGVFPLPVLADHLGRLECMARAHLSGGYIEREGYQRRSLGFCLERMHSYLVLKALRQAGLDAVAVQGYHTVLSEQDDIKPTR
jgi:hypothetical protein